MRNKLLSSVYDEQNEKVANAHLHGTDVHGLSEINSVKLPKHISGKKIVFTAKLAMFFLLMVLTLSAFSYYFLVTSFDSQTNQ